MTYHSARRHGAWLMALLLFITMLPTNAIAEVQPLFSPSVSAASIFPGGWPEDTTTVDDQLAVQMGSTNDQTKVKGVYRKGDTWYLLLFRRLPNKDLETVTLSTVSGVAFKTVSGTIPPTSSWYHASDGYYYALNVGSYLPYKFIVEAWVTSGGGHDLRTTITIGSPGSIVVTHVLVKPDGSYYSEAKEYTQDSPTDKYATIIRYDSLTQGGVTGYYSSVDPAITWTAQKTYEAPFKGPKNYTVYYLPRMYTVTFKPGDHGTLAGADQNGNVVHTGVKHGDPLPDRPVVNPAAGYSHTGWTPTPFVDPVTGDATYTATYTASGYKLKYQLVDANGNNITAASIGATGMPGDQPYTVESPATIGALPTATGYTFTGWSENKTGTPQVTGTYSKVPASGTEVTLYAKAVANSYKLKYQLVDANGNNITAASIGATGMPGDQPYTVANPATIGALPTATGYTFMGWSENKSGTPQLTGTYGKVPASGTEATLYAKAEQIEYDVTYMLDGQQYGDIEKWHYGDLVPLRGDPTETGSTFGGWNLPMGITLGADRKFTMPAGNVVIVGNFSKNTYTLTYLVDNELYGEIEGHLYNEEVTVRGVPTKTGYTFGGWQYPASISVGQDGKFRMPAENVVITGVFTPNTDTKYTIQYFLQNLALTDYDHQVDEDKEKKGTTGTLGTVVKPDDIKQFEGFTFDENNSNNRLSGNIAGDGSLVLKVYYKRNEYTVTFKPGDHGTLAGADQNGNVVHTGVKHGDPLPARPVVTPETGYSHTGWTPDFVDPVTGDAIYTATYEQIEYDVTYMLDGQQYGTLRSGITATWCRCAAIRPRPVRPSADGTCRWG